MKSKDVSHIHVRSLGARTVGPIAHTNTRTHTLSLSPSNKIASPHMDFPARVDYSRALLSGLSGLLRLRTLHLLFPGILELHSSPHVDKHMENRVLYTSLNTPLSIKKQVCGYESSAGV